MRNRTKPSPGVPAQKGPSKADPSQQKKTSGILCLLIEALFLSFVGLLLVSTALHHFLMFDEAVSVADFQHNLNGTYVPFDGKKIFVECSGPKNNNPVVFLVNGLGGILLSDWAGIYEELEKKTHVCRYDPLGFGYSDVLDEPSTLLIEYSVNQLRTIYNYLEMSKTPKVIVGHSMGGLTTRLLIHKYHKEDNIIAGILVDSTTVKILQEAIIPDFPKVSAMIKSVPWLNFFGISRALYFLEIHPAEAVFLLPDEKSKLALQYFQYQTSYSDAVLLIASQMNDSLAWIDKTILDNPLSNQDTVQLRIISASEKDPLFEIPDNRHLVIQTELYSSYPKSLTKNHIIAEKCGHYLQLQRPDLVLELINEFLVS